MNKTLLLLLLSYCFSAKFVSAQELSLYVKKGKALIEGKEFKAGEIRKVNSNLKAREDELKFLQYRYNDYES